MMRSKPGPRARLIRARTMVGNVRDQAGRETDLRLQLANLLRHIDEVLSNGRYVVDLPAVERIST